MSRSETLKSRWRDLPAEGKQAWRDKISASMRQFWVTKATPDLTRRHFIFGATATLLLPPPRTFHFLPKASDLIVPLEERGLILPSGKLFDLPSRESIMMAQKLL